MCRDGCAAQPPYLQAIDSRRLPPVRHISPQPRTYRRVNIALLQSEAVWNLPVTDLPDRHESISAGGLARLLERLHPDETEAALEYERLRGRLVKFFDWRGVPNPDECADEALDRLTEKIADTQVHDPVKYAYGIARLVALERRRGPAFASIDEVPPAVIATTAPTPEGDDLQTCFDGCLAALPDEGRQLLLQYYEGERQAKIANRRRLASSRGLTDNALRSRVQRLRDQLELCVRGCVASPMGLPS